VDAIRIARRGNDYDAIIALRRDPLSFRSPARAERQAGNRRPAGDRTGYAFRWTTVVFDGRTVTMETPQKPSD
jgi:hypothetical protein